MPISNDFRTLLEACGIDSDEDTEAISEKLDKNPREAAMLMMLGIVSAHNLKATHTMQTFAIGAAILYTRISNPAAADVIKEILHPLVMEIRQRAIDAGELPTTGNA